MLIISYIRRVLATGYGIISFIKCLKGSRSTRASISNIKSRKKRREPRSRKIEKIRRKEELLYFQKPKNREDIIICSVIYIHVRHFPPNMLCLGPRDTGYIPYSFKWGFNHILFIRSFTCPCWTRTVPFVKNHMIMYGDCFYNQVISRCLSFPHKLDHL